MRCALLVIYLVITTATVFAQSPRELLVGSWYFKRGIGRPCETLIVELEYHFNKDGNYRSRAKMRGGEEYRYNGTYIATDTSATAIVDGISIGPFPYSIKDDVLKINQPDSDCDVELEKD